MNFNQTKRAGAAGWGRLFFLSIVLGFLLLPLRAEAGGTPTVISFTNSAPIIIVDGFSQSSPTNSTIQITNLPGVLQSLTVTIYGLEDPSTPGIELLLQGPSGQGLDLMQDAGSGGATNVNITFADSGAPFPNSALTSGTNQPSGTEYPFLSPFYQADTTNTLAGFIGTTLEGTWSLSEFYYASVNPGAITNGWSLSFTMLNSAPSVTTLAASGITNTSAILNASVDPDLGATTVYFEYGPTTNYGNYSATNTLASDLVDVQAVASAISNLLAGTTNHFQAVAQNSSGTNFGGDLTVVTPAYSPVLAAVSDQSVNVGSLLLVTNYVSETNVPPRQVSFSLGAGAPAGALISPKGVFEWFPTCEQGSTTNFITVWAIDNGTPALSNSVSFNVVVSACVEVTVGSSAVLIGNDTSVPVNLYSTVSLTNVNFTLATLAGRFGNWGATAAANLTATVQGADPSQPQFNFGVQSGPPLLRSNSLGTISVHALPAGNSGFAPLTMNNLVATAPDGTLAGPVFGQSGRVVLIAAQPLLETTLTNHNIPVLTLYGNPGSNYTILAATNLLAPIHWTTNTSLTLSTPFQFINLGPVTNLLEIFQAVQH